MHNYICDLYTPGYKKTGVVLTVEPKKELRLIVKGVLYEVLSVAVNTDDSTAHIGCAVRSFDYIDDEAMEKMGWEKEGPHDR